MSASSKHTYTHEIMKFPRGMDFHTLKYACGLSNTSLETVDRWLRSNNLPYTLVKAGGVLNTPSHDSIVVFLSAKAFSRSLKALGDKTSIVLDGLLRLIEIEGLPVLDATYPNIQQVSTAWTRVNPDLTVLLNESPVPITVRARRINFGLLTLTAATNGGLYQKMLTLVENNSNPIVQRTMKDYIHNLVYGSDALPDDKAIVDHMVSFSTENQTRTAFIEKFVEAITSPYGQKVCQVLRDNIHADSNDLWDLEDTQGLVRGDLFLTRGMIGVPA